jgi:hypothetical protein
MAVRSIIASLSSGFCLYKVERRDSCKSERRYIAGPSCRNGLLSAQSLSVLSHTIWASAILTVSNGIL